MLWHGNFGKGLSGSNFRFFGVHGWPKHWPYKWGSTVHDRQVDMDLPDNESTTYLWLCVAVRVG